MEDELSDGDIVWVKVSNSWWPGEVMGDSRLTEEFLSSLRKKPLAVVKFFQEDSYEYVKNPNFIFKYNCPRKNEFLRKGLEQYRAKMKHMEKFPADVMHAERVTGGDPDIVNSTDFQPQKKERHSGLFQDGRSPAGKGKGPKEKANTSPKTTGKPDSFESFRKSMHVVRILGQPSKATSESDAGASLPTESVSLTAAQSLLSSPGQVYHCYKCNNYSANRQNLIMLHIKHCRASYTTPSRVSSSSTTTPTAPSRRDSYEKEDDSAAEDDVEQEAKPDQSRRSIPAANKARSFGTPIRNVDLQIPPKVESSSEKRTRGGRKTVALNETPKNKKIARRRNKRGQSPEPDEDESFETKLNETEDNRRSSTSADKQSGRPQDDGNRQEQTNSVSVTTARDESTTIGIKNSTDVKLKNELLADWSEDEQEEDEAVKEQESEKKLQEDVQVAEEQTASTKDSSSAKPVKPGTKKQHKEAKKENVKHTLASKRTTKMEVENDASTISESEQSVNVEERKKDMENSQEDNTTVATVQTVTVAAISSASSATIVPTVAPTASPHATIKYRNIPKKQKREFIEVTNDDVSMVQEKHAVPSREGSTASSSSTTGSNELCIGNAQSSVSAPATERPISAKQLILNRATRGSSKSLSGDENTTTTSTSADDGGAAVNTESTASKEQKSQSDDAKKKTDAPRQESSCFDFNDDEEERQQKRVSHTSAATVTARLERKVDPAMRQKSVSLEPEPQEVDRDVKLSQEIDSLLCEMDVPKLPEALSDVMAVVSDKIDCNRTLPPKERGKRIFKTRNKTVVATTPPVSPNRNDSSGDINQDSKSQSEMADIDVDSHATTSNVGKDKNSKKQQTSEEETRVAKDKSEPTKEQDHQNPSVTSSAMTEETVTKDAVDQQQSAKKKRKSEDVLLPDSSGNNGDQMLSSTVRRRGGKFGKAVTETSEKPSESALSSRKSKRNRRDASFMQEITPITVSNDKDAEENNTTERVSKKMETATTGMQESADGNAMQNDAPPSKKQSIETVVTHSPSKKEDIVLTKKSSLVPSVAMTSEPTAADLQVAEALINLPVAATVLPPVSSSNTGKDSEETKEPIKVAEAGQETKDTIETNTVPSSSLPVSSIASTVSQNIQTSTSNSGSSMAKSINPRKRHLQSMLLTTTETPHTHSKKLVVAVASDSSVPSLTSSTNEDEIVTMNVVVPTKQDPLSIPEQNKQNESILGEDQAKELTENDKFDISNMPIVMDDSELLVDDASPPVVTAAAITVMKGVNGAGSAGKIETLQPLSTTTTRDKRPTTVATVKGGRASKEQIVITSKGTVLTTSTASVAVASKFSTTSKSSVSVTSAITLGSSCRLASSTPTLAPNGSQQTSTTSPTAASSVTTQIVAPKIILTKKPLPNAAAPYVASTPTSDGADSGKPKVQERRTSGDGASSSVSSSSGSDAGGKKSHRVLRLTPQKLKEFSRLGYIEDRQGKGKMLTKSGMRQLYGKQAQLKQQLQRADPHASKKKPVPNSTKLITTSDASDVVEGSDSTSSSRATSQPEVASSGSNVVIAAAADSSVQESSAATGRSVMADPSVADIDEEEELLDQHNKVTTEMEPPAPSLVAPAGATILLEGAPTSSGTGTAEVILGSTAELTVVGGSMAEASSSSGPATATGSGMQESSQLVAVTAENFGGPPNLFYLCSVRDETFVRVNDELLYLDASNQLVALPEQHQQHPSQQQGQHHSQQVAGALTEDIIHQAEVILPTIGNNGADLSGDGTGEVGANAALADASGAVVNDGTQQSFLLNTQDGQHIILDQQSLMALAAGGDTSHIITADGQQIVLQETAQEWLAALSASQQQQQAGTVSTLVTPEGTQIIVAHENAGLIELQEHPVLLPTEIIQVNPNTTIETNAVLTKPPIMSTVEVPTKNGIESASRASEKRSTGAASARTVAGTVASGSTSSTGSSTNLDESLAAVIGHVPTNPHVPTSLELPITVTNPIIAKTSTASSRINTALFPLTTTATNVSSLTDTIPAAAAAAVVLVSGAEVPGTIDRVPSTSPLAALPPSSPSSPAVKGDDDEGQALDDDDGSVVLESEDKPFSPMVEPTIASCTDEDDIQIPNTPESNHSTERHQQLDDEFSAADEQGDDAPNDTRNHLLVDEDEANSNCSEIIAIQPNVVVLDAELLLNSPPNDDGIDDEMENDTEDEEERNERVVPVGSFFEQPPSHRSRTVAARSTNGAGGDDGRPDTLNLAEHHNSSNNDSGIDTSMATAAGAVCEAAGSSGAGRESGGHARRTIVER